MQLYYKAKAKEETTSLTWVISQKDPAIEITHFKGMSLSGLCLNEFFILNRG